MNKEEQAVPPHVAFSIESIRTMPPEVFGSLICRQIEQLSRENELKVGWHTFRSFDELARWFRNLPTKTFAEFFEAIQWPPKGVAEARARLKEEQSRKAKRAKPVQHAAAKPRAKRSKTKAEVRKAKPSKKEPDLITPGAQLRFTESAQADENNRERVLAYLKGRQNVPANELKTFLGLTDGQTKGILKRLREQGSIRVEGKNRGARYSLATKPAKGADEEE